MRPLPAPNGGRRTVIHWCMRLTPSTSWPIYYASRPRLRNGQTSALDISRSGVRTAHKAPRDHVTQSLVVTGGMRPRRRHVVVSNSSAVNGVPASATCSLQTESACSAFHEEDGPDEPHPASAAVFIGRVVICTSFRRLSSGVSFSAPSISSDCCRTPRVRVPAQSPHSPVTPAPARPPPSADRPACPRRA